MVRAVLGAAFAARLSEEGGRRTAANEPRCGHRAVAIGLVLLLCPGIAHSEVHWEPCPLPAEIKGPVTARLLVLDNSGSMPGKSRLARARAAARHAISTSEIGSYVILATFGTEARVVKDRFVFTEYDRQVLIDAVEGVVMHAQHTDVAVLEGLIEDIRSALATHFAARGFRMPVEVFTDGRPDPGDGRHQTFDTLLGERTTKTDLGDGLLLFRLSFEQLSPEEQAHEAPKPPQVTNAPAQTAEVTAPARTAASAARPRWVGGGMVITLLIVLVLLGVRHRLNLLADPSPPRQPEAPAADVPRVILVTELEEVDGQRRILREGESIPIAPGAPVTFGRDESSTYRVIPVPDEPAKELFRITPMQDGALCLEAAGGVLCDGVPVPKRGLRRRANQQLRVQLGNRVWRIALSNQGRESAAVDNLFARIAAGSGVRPPDVAPQG